MTYSRIEQQFVNCLFLTDQLFPGQMVVPSRVVIAVCTESAYMGHYNKNPYYFPIETADFVKIEDIKLSLNGETVDGIVLDGSKEMDYVKLLTYLGMSEGYSNGLTLKKYLGGTVIITKFDIIS